jgi:hypothetical protein
MRKNKEIQDKNIHKENLLKTTVSNNNDKSFTDLSNSIKDLQKYILKLEKENVVSKNEFIKYIRTKTES